MTFARVSSVATVLVGVLSVVNAARAQQVRELIVPGVVRYHASAAAEAGAQPSLALHGSWPGIGPEPGGFPFNPVFADEGARKVVVVPIPAGTDLYGTGMVSGPMRRNGRFVTCWNDDSYGYGDGDNQLYQSHPWVLGVRPDGSAFGVIADTTWRCDVDLTQPDAVGIRFSAEGPFYPIIIIDRPGPRQVLEALALLTGTMPMPPKWSLGYQQSRFSYWNQTYALGIADEFRNRNIPCDVVWLDIDYMDGYRCFTFNPVNFPISPPNQMAFDAQMEARGFRTVWMINPGIKNEAGYWVNDEAWVQDHYVKACDGVTNFVGTVWPGASCFPDFTRAATRTWWAGLYVPYMRNGVDGVWNDMNEPALLNTFPNTFPECNVHRGDAELGGTQPHGKYHNVYGMLMTRATREGIQLANPDKRPFVLTRANYLGGHRYAATWTGDNRATWHHLNLSVSMVLTLGLSAQPFAGPDIGGFINSPESTGALYGRWVGVGAMLPFARAHYEGGPAKEPWSFGSAVEETCRRAINRRYRLMPLIYTLFREAATTGVPPVRPLFFADPSDLGLRNEDDAFLLGDDVMVVPQVTPNRDRIPAEPGGIWRKFDWGDSLDPDLPELYLRGGAIITSGPVMQHVDQSPLDPLTLIVSLDAGGHAVGRLYEDDGDGFDYLSGDYLLTTYEAIRVGNHVTVSVASTEGSRPRPARGLHVRLLLGCNREATATGVDGLPVVVSVPPAPAWCPDGRGIPADHPPPAVVATQTNATGFGDNLNELNRMFVQAETAGLRIGLTGNLEANGNAVLLFIDSQPGGQNVLATAGAPQPPNGVAQLDGLRFDAGFAPDHLLFINASGAHFFVDQFALLTGGGVNKTFRGQGVINNHEGLLTGGVNPDDLRVAFDNLNSAGVTASSPDDAATATRGFESVIPWTYLGVTFPPSLGQLKVVAFVSAPNGFVSNQWLPGLPASTPNPGFIPDLTTHAGDQFAIVPLVIPGDLDFNGSVQAADAALFVEVLLGLDTDPARVAASDVNGDGVVNGLDVQAFIAALDV